MAPITFVRASTPRRSTNVTAALSVTIHISRSDNKEEMRKERKEKDATLPVHLKTRSRVRAAASAAR